MKWHPHVISILCLWFFSTYLVLFFVFYNILYSTCGQPGFVTWCGNNGGHVLAMVKTFKMASARNLYSVYLWFFSTNLVHSLSLMQFMLHGVATMADVLTMVKTFKMASACNLYSVYLWVFSTNLVHSLSLMQFMLHSVATMADMFSQW